MLCQLMKHTSPRLSVPHPTMRESAMRFGCWKIATNTRNPSKERNCLTLPWSAFTCG